jgi:hypothetical protein
VAIADGVGGGSVGTCIGRRGSGVEEPLPRRRDGRF